MTRTIAFLYSFYEFIKEGGWNVGFIKKQNYVSGFTGSKAKEKLLFCNAVFLVGQ